MLFCVEIQWSLGRESIRMRLGGEKSWENCNFVNIKYNSQIFDYRSKLRIFEDEKYFGWCNMQNNGLMGKIKNLRHEISEKTLKIKYLGKNSEIKEIRDIGTLSAISNILVPISEISNMCWYWWIFQMDCMCLMLL